MTRAGVALVHVILLGVLARYLAHLFHIDGLQWPSAGLGSWADPYFINYVLESWLYAARTLSDPGSPPMFHPATGTLGYSHSLILFAPLYIGGRTFLDPFAAETLTLVATYAMGIVCLYVLLRRFIGAGYGVSVALSALVATSPNIVNTGTETWAQRVSCFLIPPILCLGAYALRMRSRRHGVALAALFGCALVSLVTQDVYTGLLFAGVAAVLYLGGWAVVRWRFVRHLWHTAVWRTGPGERRGPSRVWLVLAAIGLCLAVTIALFPIERTTIWSWRVSLTDPMRPLRLAVLAVGWYLLRQLTVPGVRRAWRAGRRAWHVSMGSLASRIPGVPLADPAAARDRVRGWTRGAIAGAILGAGIFLWIYGPTLVDHRGFSPEQIHEILRVVDPSTWHDAAAVRRSLFVYDSWRPFAILGIAIALVWWPLFRSPVWIRRSSVAAVVLSVFVCVVPLRLGDFSVWALVTTLIPGASAIRDPSRIIYVYEIVAAGVVGLLAAQVRRRQAVFRTLVVTAAAVILLVDWPTRTFQFYRSQEVFDQFVTGEIAVEGSCQSFFVRRASAAYAARSDSTWVLYAMDAAFVSLRAGLPTLNGYSAWTPAGWDLADPEDPTYLAGVRDWIARHRLPGVCALDLEARTMTPFQ